MLESREVPPKKQKIGCQSPKLHRKSMSPVQYLDVYKGRHWDREKKHQFFKFISDKKIPRISTKLKDVAFKQRKSTEEQEEKSQEDNKSKATTKKKSKDQIQLTYQQSGKAKDETFNDPSILQEFIDTFQQSSFFRDVAGLDAETLIKPDIIEEQRKTIENQTQIICQMQAQLKEFKDKCEKANIVLGVQRREGERIRRNLRRVKTKYSMLKNKCLYTLSDDSDGN